VLLAAYGAGDLDAARVLTARLSPRALSQAARMLGDRAEAEDVVQEALLRLWRIAPDWRQGEAQVSTWLWRVVANLSTDRLRARQRGVPLDSVAEPEDGRRSVAEEMQAPTRCGRRWRNSRRDRPRRWPCGIWRGWAIPRSPGSWT
jgi:RNA polymerase sigma-70 factor (ECF subfamily)